MLVLLSSPLLSRLYGPADFGALAAYASLLSVLLVCVNLRYDFAIVRPKHDEEAFRLLGLALLCALAVSLLLLAAVPLLVPALGTVLPAMLTWLLPLGLLLSGVYQALNYWAVRQGAGRAIGQTRLTQSASMVGLQLLGGVLGGSPLGLVAGYIAGQAAGTGRLVRQVPRSLSTLLRPASLWRTALAYRRFPLLSLPSGLANVAALQLPTLFVAHTYGVETAGWLTLAQRVLGGPLDLLGAGVSQAFMGELSRNQHEPARLHTLFGSVARRLALLGLLVLLAGALCPLLFGPLFGAEWQPAGTLAALLSLMYAGRLLGGALSQTLIVLDRLNWMFAIDLLRLALVLAVFALFKAQGYVALIGAYSVTMALTYLLYFFAARAALQRPLSRNEASS
nr:oligosaccharide flippase family protein [Deinobacterium chartae]